MFLGELFEARKKEHPFEGTRIGLELEFVVSVEPEEYENIDKEEKKKILDMVARDLKDFVPNFRIVTIVDSDKVKAKDQNTLYLTTEWSLTTSKRLGVELVTPPFSGSGEQIERKLVEVINGLRSMVHGNTKYETTPRTGLHVNVSLTNMELDNYLKMIVATMYSTSHMLEEPERERFASTITAHLPSPHYVIDDDSRKYNRKEILDIIWDRLHKNPAMRSNLATSPRERYVEFRPLGGRNYLDRNPLEKFRKIVVGYKNFLRKNLEKKARKLVARLMKSHDEEIIDHSENLFKFWNLLDDLADMKMLSHEISNLFKEFMYRSPTRRKFKENLIRETKTLITGRKWKDLTKLFIVMKLLNDWSELYGYDLLPKNFLEKYVELLEKLSKKYGSDEYGYLFDSTKIPKKENIEWMVKSKKLKRHLSQEFSRYRRELWNIAWLLVNDTKMKSFGDLVEKLKEKIETYMRLEDTHMVNQYLVVMKELYDWMKDNDIESVDYTNMKKYMNGIEHYVSSQKKKRG